MRLLLMMLNHFHFGILLALSEQLSCNCLHLGLKLIKNKKKHETGERILNCNLSWFSPVFLVVLLLDCTTGPPFYQWNACIAAESAWLLTSAFLAGFFSVFAFKIPHFPEIHANNRSAVLFSNSMECLNCSWRICLIVDIWLLLDSFCFCFQDSPFPRDPCKQ